jgi:ribosomal protein S27E
MGMDVNKLGVVCEKCGSESTYLHSQCPHPVIWCANCSTTLHTNVSQTDQLIADIKELEAERQEP